jgi:hypothetical protein
MADQRTAANPSSRGRRTAWHVDVDWNNTAEALLYGVLLLQKKIRRTATI